jgi:WD40 repeat protein
MKRGSAVAVLAALGLPVLAFTALRPFLATRQPFRWAKATHRAHRVVLAVAFDAAGNILSLGSEGALKTWNARDGHATDAWHPLESGMGAVAAQFSGDGTMLAFARLDGLFDVWDVPRRSLRRRFRVPQCDDFGFSILSLSRDGSAFAVAPAMGDTGIWDTQTGALRMRLPTDSTRWGRMALSPSGDRLARSGRTPLEIWDVGARSLLRRLDASTIDPVDIAWEPNGGRLALAPNVYGKQPDALLLSDPAEPRRHVALDLAPGSSASALAFSADGHFLAAGVVAPVADAALGAPQARAVPEVWDWRRRTALFDRRGPLPFQGHVKDITALSWCQDGSLLASGGADGEVMVWNARTGARVAVAGR